MSQVNEALEEQVRAAGAAGPAATDIARKAWETEEEPFTPIFEDILNMKPEGALNVLIQAASQAQAAGALTVRDSVMVAQAIHVLRPGSI
jgi:hypothetical protein